MSKNIEIIMPFLTENNHFITICQWYKKDGDFVKKGELVASVENTKSMFDIEAPSDGYITHLYSVFEDVRSGSVIALLSAEKIKDTLMKTNISEIKITKGASELIEKHSLDVHELYKGKIVTETDVHDYLSQNTTIIKGLVDNGLIIYGTGGFCSTIIDIMHQTNDFKIAGIVDYEYPKILEIMSIPVIGGLDILPVLLEKGYKKIVNTVTVNRHQRNNRYKQFKKLGFEFPNIIHPRAIIEPSVALGEGNFICAGAYLGSQVTVGNNCIINANSTVSHHTILGDSVHIASGATIAGRVTIGDKVLVGQAVSIYWGIKIGDNAVIQNGCSIFDDIPDNTIINHSMSKQNNKE